MFEPADIELLHIRISNRLDRSFSPLVLYMLVIKINVPDQRCFRNLAFHRNIFLPKRIDRFRLLRHCFCAPVGNPVLHVTQAFRICIPLWWRVFREQFPVGYAFANPVLVRISECIAADRKQRLFSVHKISYKRKNRRTRYSDAAVKLLQMYDFTGILPTSTQIGIRLAHVGIQPGFSVS